MKKYILLILLINVLNVISSEKDDYYFKINKSFDIYGSLIREIGTNYVLDVDPEVLMKSGIEGMLNSLDPYTIYYDESDQDDVNLLTTGSYVGFGFIVSSLDSMLTVLEIQEGSGAKEAGVRIGDRIYQIDDEIVLNQTNEVLRKSTRGEPGTQSKVRLLRNSLKDTVELTIIRRSVKLNNVSFYGVLKNEVGYIKLERFDRAAVDEVRNALKEFQTQKVKSIILDLRDNPGGLLEAAVGICEFFVPKGSLIVSTKGRNGIKLNEYKSNKEPIEPNISLAVLINENSASASEIVAGAIQDLDRGVILGNRSYGKGLVQTVLSMPYNTALKITNAKYYTPSGRCIQRISFAEKFSKSAIKNTPDTAVFFTKNKRKVVESIGIIPDSTITNDINPEMVDDILSKMLIFKFGTQFADKLTKLPDNFDVNDNIMKEFEKYLQENNYSYESHLVRMMNHIDSMANTNELSPQLIKKIKEVDKGLKNETSVLPQNVKKELKNLIYLDVCSRFLNSKDMGYKFLKDDNTVNVAINLLKDKIYEKFLFVNGKKMDAIDN